MIERSTALRELPAKGADALFLRGMTGASEAETFWTGVPRSLARRGLRGVKPVTADAIGA
jgi:hypothetical protein